MSWYFPAKKNVARFGGVKRNSVSLGCRYCSTDNDRHLSISLHILDGDYFYLLQPLSKSRSEWPSYEMLPSLCDT